MYPSTARCPLASLHIPLGYHFEPVFLPQAPGMCKDAGMVIPTLDDGIDGQKLVERCVYDMIQNYPLAIGNLPTLNPYYLGVSVYLNGLRGVYFRNGVFLSTGNINRGLSRDDSRITARVICAGEVCSLNRNILYSGTPREL